MESVMGYNLVAREQKEAPEQLGAEKAGGRSSGERMGRSAAHIVPTEAPVEVVDWDSGFLRMDPLYYDRWFPEVACSG